MVEIHYKYAGYGVTIVYPTAYPTHAGKLVSSHRTRQAEVPHSTSLRSTHHPIPTTISIRSDLSSIGIPHSIDKNKEHTVKKFKIHGR